MSEEWTDGTKDFAVGKKPQDKISRRSSNLWRAAYLSGWQGSLHISWHRLVNPWRDAPTFNMEALDGIFCACQDPGNDLGDIELLSLRDKPREKECKYVAFSLLHHPMRNVCRTTTVMNMNSIQTIKNTRPLRMPNMPSILSLFNHEYIQRTRQV